MGTWFTLASLALGAAAQSTAGAYGQCKLCFEVTLRDVDSLTVKRWGHWLYRTKCLRLRIHLHYL